MANFLLLYSEGKMPADEAEQKAVMGDWTVWFGKLGSAVVDGSLQPCIQIRVFIYHFGN